jgi:hypothetical protein
MLGMASCTSGPAVPCDQSLLYRDSGFTLASPAGTSFAPTVIFSDPDGEHPDECHYARNQGDEVCTEVGGWVDLNPGEKDGMIDVTPRAHACGGFASDSTYSLVYSFTKIPGILWIQTWSDNQ